MLFKSIFPRLLYLTYFSFKSQSILGAEAFNCRNVLLLEGFLTPISAAVYLKSGLETPPTTMKLNN